MTDILAALLGSCERTPDAPALSLRRTTLTYRDLADRIHGVACSLTAAGLKPGDRVLFSVRPGIDGICLALGIIAAGGTVVFADPGAGEAMFRARAALAAPAWVAAESVLYAASSGPLRGIARRRGLELPDYGTVVPDARHIYAGPWLPGVPTGALELGAKAISGLRRDASADGRPGRLITGEGSRYAAAPLLDQPNREALIIFTSGTTDAPKAVVHSRASLGTGLDDFASAVGFVPGERVLTDQLMVGIPALIAGAHWQLPPVGADPGARPEKYLDLLPRADVLFAVPAALDALLRMLEHTPAKTPRLRALIVGGAPVLRPLLLRARAQLPGTVIRAVYGMTEILPVAIADGDEKLAFTGAGDYVGRVMNHVSVRIDDGELVVAGEGLALGYLGEPPLTELRTGDLARVEAHRLVLAGRSKDMFIRGSTNVYPGLYEPVIAGLPGIAEAAIVGVPDDVGDDRLVLVIVPADGYDEAALRRALPGLIDSAVLPDRIMTMSDLPRSGRSRKLDRAALGRLVSEAFA
ncbi:MAG: acyl--CoA ligase [Actinobacteria bacterium]|nr:acyl--CoA ligase [Actinomycetota bacterium]